MSYPDKDPKKPVEPASPEEGGPVEGFDIRINEFGEVISSVSIEDLNKFLDKKKEEEEE